MSEDPVDWNETTGNDEDSPDKTKEDGTLEEPEPNFDYSDAGSSGSNDSTDPFSEMDGPDSGFGGMDFEDDIDPSEAGVDQEESKQEQNRFGIPAIKEIKQRIWTRENIPSMPSMPSRDQLPSRKDISEFAPDIFRRSEQQAGEETGQEDSQTAQEDPETSVDEDPSVDNPDIDEAVEDVADDTPELPTVELKMPDQSDVAPLEDTFQEEREFLRGNISSHDVESAVNRAISTLSKGTQGLIKSAEETNENLESITSQMISEVVQNDVEQVTSWVSRWNRVVKYIEYVSSSPRPRNDNSVALEKNILNGAESFNADGRDFLNGYQGLKQNNYGLRQIKSDLEVILQNNLRPLGGNTDQKLGKEARLMKNLVNELEKSQRIYSRLLIFRLNLDFIEEEQGDFVKIISEIDGGAIRNQNLRQNMKSELQAIEQGEKQLADIARLENSILKNMMEANKIIKRLYEIDSHEFERLYKAGEGRQGVEEDLRNLIDSLNIDRDSEVYSEFEDIKQMMREVAELSEAMETEKADEIMWYMKVSKMISNIIESEKHYYESVAEEEASYEEELNEEMGEAESSEIPEHNELEKNFIQVYNQYNDIDADHITSELEVIRSELKDMVAKTSDEEEKFRNLDSDVKDLKKILDGIEELNSKASQGEISEKEFKNRVIKGAGEYSLDDLTEKLNEISAFLEDIEDEEHVLKEEHEDLKTKFSYLVSQLEELKELRHEALEIHQTVEEDDIVEDFGERVNPEIGGNFMRFIGNLESAGGLEDIINEDRELLEKETKLEAEELEMLRNISREMQYLEEVDYGKLDLEDHARSKINQMKSALNKFDHEIKRVRKVKAKALNIDKEELESF